MQFPGKLSFEYRPAKARNANVFPEPLSPVMTPIDLVAVHSNNKSIARLIDGVVRICSGPAKIGADGG
jgi:hypothetical protein